MISEAHKKLDESASDVDVHVKKATTPLPKGKVRKDSVTDALVPSASQLQSYA